MIKQLQKKFIKIAMGSIMAVLICIVGIINVINFRNVDSVTDTRLDFIQESQGKMPLRDIPFKRGHMSPETPFDTRFFTVHLNKEGEILYSETSMIAAIKSLTASEYAEELYKNGKTEGFKGIYKYRSFSTENEEIYIFLDCERELDGFKNFLFASVTVSVIGLTAVFILVMFFSKKAVKPIAESYDKQKRFITDASHEIKTPLTIIGANTEVLEMTGGENEWTRSIKKQIQRLAGLTENLVFLSKMDEENNEINVEEICLSEIVSEEAEEFAVLAEAAEKSFESDIDKDINCLGNKETIRRALSILLDNSIKYSDEGGSIRISLKQNGKAKQITVWNTVESIEKGNHNELFERFYRRDPSRSSKTSGYGIGLSVAKAIVQSHKGRISALSEDGKSLEFNIIL